jgi:hypothetical protein
VEPRAQALQDTGIVQDENLDRQRVKSGLKQ